MAERAQARTTHAEIRINGVEQAWDLAPDVSLADVLRDRLNLTGTKVACGVGECGTCTVLVDGQPVMACLVLAARTTGDVTTVEGLHGPAAEALRASFAAEGAFQCGYCTPGQLMRCHALLVEAATERADSTTLSDESVRHALAGNICRCTGYASIVRAVQAALVNLASPMDE